MVNDIAKYAEFLKLFIEHFKAYNECIEAKYQPKDKPKKQRSPIFNNDPRTMRDLDAPLHFAVRQLNEGFIEWLLKQSETDVNLRNKQRQTPLAILCVMYDWYMETMPKLKLRIEEIKKERETADKMQQIWLDEEEIEVSAQKEELEMNAPTILKLIKRLLEKGADFNIYMNVGALPFDFLRKYDTEADVAEIINSQIKSNVAMTENPSKQLNADAEGKIKSKNRIVEFYKKSKDKDDHVTVELLEIFICFNDLQKFKQYWENFEVTSDNVKKVITLLLHVAVERNYTSCVELIIKKASKEIFKVEQNKAKDTQVTRSVPPGRRHTLWCRFTDSSLSMSAEDFSDSQTVVNSSFNVETDTHEQRPNSKPKDGRMVHRTELKGLLKKMDDRLLVNENPLLINTLNGAYTMKQKKESAFLLECAKILINNHSKVDMYRVDMNGNTALHLALSYGYENLALLMLKHGNGLMRFMNNQNFTPIDYGRRQFWEDYLDNCITAGDRTELKLNVNFLQPLAKKEPTESKPKVSCYGSWLSCFKFFKPMKELHNSKYHFARTVNDMTALRLISLSKDRKEFLMHPVIVAFIIMKWERLCHWNILNFLLTTITMFTFAGYTLLSPGTLKDFGR
ncbi:AGAP001011-PA-like protein [Anopheles sinensis]|uniref:AGAP001011-PA-like protein n=1 Tax=Anopheles sinensis TaxID=74873 RepID=A0A084VML1_ANOSI|nr:AGAP001011-PA-like protein [Anopheles sinensis]